MASLETARKVALFGGTFDPVHAGHLAIASAAVAAVGLDQVVFLPARLSPHKTGQSAGADASHRLAMLQLATDGLPWAEVSSWEMEQSPPSWSWRTARHFHQAWPGCRLFWILGADQWACIEDWARPDLLRELLEFLVFPRPPAPDPGFRPGWRSRVLPIRHPASATAIRGTLASGTSPIPDLPGPVADYICRHNLYSSTLRPQNPPNSP